MLEPEDGLIGIGSGGNYALAAARALIDIDGLDAEAIARKAMKIAAGICVYTNEIVTVESSMSSAFSPREIVSELDRFIVGQHDAKRAVAIALRNRWRRQQLPEALRDEVLPKNILMIGPTGVGKTEIARRLARLAQAPFLKVEATKFTEVGYVGRDVEQIVRDLVETAIIMTRERLAQAGHGAGRTGRRRAGPRRPGRRERQQRDPPEIPQAAARRRAERPRDRGPGGRQQRRHAQLRNPRHARRPDGHGQSRRHVRQGLRRPHQAAQDAVGESYAVLVAEESDKLLDQEKVVKEAIHAVENNGIVFLDEIDKICARSGEWKGGDVSREGVQRDLLPLIEGTTVNTKHGPVKTDHVLFIASGAFHLAKPSDLLPELQGRLPIRVELKALTRDDLRPHPDRARGQPDQPVQGAAGDRGGDARLHRRRHRRHRRSGRRDQRRRREHRRAAAAYGDGTPAGGHQFHRHRQGRHDGDHRRRAGARERSAIWPRTPICRSSFCDLIFHHGDHGEVFMAIPLVPVTTE